MKKSYLPLQHKVYLKYFAKEVVSKKNNFFFEFFGTPLTKSQ